MNAKQKSEDKPFAREMALSLEIDLIICPDVMKPISIFIYRESDGLITD